MSATAPHDQLLRDAVGGNDEALAALVKLYGDRVHRFGLRVCRDGFDADDAVQEAFTKLARRPDVQRDPGVLSWLFTVVRHTCARLLRPFWRERAHLGARLEEAEEIASPQLSPEAMLERWRLVERVQQAIATLDRPYREVLVLRDLEGLPGETVCATLGISQAAMKSRLHRARTAIRDWILRDERGREGN
jgi:RNA polymerase sigma-70 factor (ECF subfamily)